MSRNQIRCPAPSCRGGYARQQHNLPEKAREWIPEDDRGRIETFPGIVQRCIYCDCVYGRSGSDTEIFGFLNHKWRPYRRYETEEL